jgi:hypothetical protein
MLIIYEIMAAVRSDLRAAYEQYMIDEHIPDLLRTGHFTRAAIMRNETGGTYRICYESPSREFLDQYLSDHAQRLRAEMIEHFPSGVEVSREIWSVLSTQ